MFSVKTITNGAIVSVFPARVAYLPAPRFERWMLLFVLLVSLPLISTAQARPTATGFAGIWKTVKGHEGLQWGEPQLVIIQQRGANYFATGKPGFHTSGHLAIPQLVLKPIDNGRTLEYVYLPGGNGIPRYYDLKLSPDKSTLFSWHHSKFGVFGGAKYVRFAGKSTSI